MAEPPDRPATGRDIRRLTIAVWALAAAVVLHAGLSLLGRLSVGVDGPGLVSRLASTEMPSPDRIENFNGFEDWPPETQVAVAAVIVRTRQHTESDERVDVVAEVIKHVDGAPFGFKVGDVLRRAPVRPSLPELEGWVVFYAGSPPREVYGATYERGRIGHSGLSLERLRDLARQAP